MTVAPSLQCLRLKSYKRLWIGSVVKKKKVDVLDQEMVDKSESENEGYKAHSEGNGKIGLESTLPQNLGLSRTLKGWKRMMFVNDTGKWSHCNG